MDWHLTGKVLVSMQPQCKIYEWLLVTWQLVNLKSASSGIVCNAQQGARWC